MKRFFLALGITVLLLASPNLVRLSKPAFYVVFPDVRPLTDKKLKYEERKTLAYQRYKDEIEKEIKGSTVCSPDFETSCFLNTALDRLISSGFKEEAAYKTFVRLSETARKTKQTEIMKRILEILRSDFIKKSSKSENRRDIEIAKMVFALGNFDEGMALLQNLKGKQFNNKYSDVPQIAAIRALLDVDDPDTATTVAQETKSWPFVFEKYESMHHRSSNGDIIEDIARAYLKENKLEDAENLLPIISDEDNSVYANAKDVKDFQFIVSQYRKKAKPNYVPPEQALMKELDGLVAKADKLSPRELSDLAERLRYVEHPAYPDFEKYDTNGYATFGSQGNVNAGDYLFSRDKALIRIKYLVAQGRLLETEELYRTFIPEDDYATAVVLDNLIFSKNTENEFFEKVWREYIKDCLVLGLIGPKETSDMGVLTAYCYTNRVIAMHPDEYRP